MKTLGVLLVFVAMAIGFVSDTVNPLSKEPFIVLAFAFWMVGMYILILENNEPTRK